jgi:hypothetical protein
MCTVNGNIGINCVLCMVIVSGSCSAQCKVNASYVQTGDEGDMSMFDLEI